MKISDNDLEKKLRESKEEIKESKKDNAYEIYENAKGIDSKKVNIFSSIRFYKIASALMIVLCIVLVVVFSSVNAKLKSKPRNVIYYEGASGNSASSLALDHSVSLTSLDSLKEMVSSTSFDRQVSSGIVWEEDESIHAKGDTGSSWASTSVPSSSTSTYKTNTQVDNVDEADIVKVYKDTIFYIPAQNNYRFYYYSSDKEYTPTYVYVLKTSGKNVDIAKKIEYNYTCEFVLGNEEASIYNYTYSVPMDLYCSDKYLIVRVNTYTYDELKENGTITRRYNYHVYAEIQVYNIEDYSFVTSIKTAGENISTRLIDNDLYVVNNYYVYNNDYIPSIIIDGVTYKTNLSCIYYCPRLGASYTYYTAIYKIILDDDITVKDYYFLTPSINNIYVTEKAIYLIKSYGSQTFDLGDNKKENCTTSLVLPISIENEIYAQSIVTVKGSISDKYWIDEYNGYLRIASTGSKTTFKVLKGEDGQEYNYGYQSSVFNYLTIFKLDDKGEWVEYSSIKEGLGEEGENIKSARFNKEICTIVTFRQTDPLYYIDLTDHANPIITSELKVSGFTVYQHPYKDNYVIGIGYESDANGRTLGYKIALFDISNKDDIKQVGDSITFLYNTNSSNYLYYSISAINNPKEIMIDLDRDMFGFEIRDYKRTYNNSYRTYEYEYKYYVFRIDLSKENPLSIELAKGLTCDSNSYYSNTSNSRMVFIGDYYYLISKEEVVSYTYNNGFSQEKTKSLK